MLTFEMAESAAERLWSRVEKSSECWEWSGCKTAKHGYGRIMIWGKDHMAHRVAYLLANGEIPNGLVIDHICHNPPCVNPAHLRAVTVKQNTENYGRQLSSNTSGVRGVSWVKSLRRWVVRVVHDGHVYSGKTHATLAEAEAAAIELRRSLHTHNDLDRIGRSLRP